MSRRHRSTNTTFSLFSFQDIITSVMGIVVLIVLMIAIELATRRLDTPASRREAILEDVSAQITQVTDAIAKLQDRLAVGGGAIAPLTKNEIENELRVLEEITAALMEKHRAAQDRTKKLEEAAAAEKFRAENSPSSKGLEQQREELAALEQELVKIRLSKHLVFRRSPGETKLAWIVEIQEDLILCAPVGRKQPPRRFVGAAASQVIQWASTLDRSANYFVLMSKPGGATMLHSIEDGLRSRGYSVGLDVLGADQGAIDPETGVPTVDDEEEN